MRQSRWILAVVLLLAQSCFPALWGDTIYSDIQREFSGSPLTNNNNGVATPAPQSCEATLTAEEAAGQIPGSESCYCPVGATTPTCVQNTSNQCQAVLADEQQRMGSGYQCTCPSGASTPQCVSYYQLCEDNLPYYQNGTNQCSCSQGTTSATPVCVSDYQICEQNAGQYENSNTSCSCSQTSTHPTCCTKTTTQNCNTTQQCSSTQGAEEDCWLDYGDNGSGPQWYGWKVWTFNNGSFNVLTCATSPSDLSNPLPLNNTLYNCYPPIYVFPGGCDFNPVSTTCNPVTTCTPVTTQSCTTEP
jgi:hypothetical protein